MARKWQKWAKMVVNFAFIWTSGKPIDVISIQQLDNVVFYRLRYLNRGRCPQIWHKSPKPLEKLGCGRPYIAIAAVFGWFSYGIPVPHKILGVPQSAKAAVCIRENLGK